VIAAPAFLNRCGRQRDYVSGADRGKIAVAHGFAHHGERCAQASEWRPDRGNLVGGTRFVSEQKVVAELTSRYAKRSRAPSPKAQRKLLVRR